MHDDVAPSLASLAPALRTRRGVRAPRSVRGGACVELLLSVPFLILFSIATFDFVRGARTVACADRAARHVAWAQSRHTEDEEYPEPPSNDDLRSAHFYGTSAEITTATAAETVDNPISKAVDTVFDLFDMNKVGRGVVPFLTGEVALDTGTATCQVIDVRLFPGATVSKTHKVSLQSRPEEDPEDPEGWFDPFKRIWDEIEGLFK